MSLDLKAIGTTFFFPVSFGLGYLASTAIRKTLNVILPNLQFGMPSKDEDLDVFDSFLFNPSPAGEESDEDRLPYQEEWPDDFNSFLFNPSPAGEDCSEDNHPSAQWMDDYDVIDAYLFRPPPPATQTSPAGEVCVASTKDEAKIISVEETPQLGVSDLNKEKLEEPTSSRKDEVKDISVEETPQPGVSELNKEKPEEPTSATKEDVKDIGVEETPQPGVSELNKEKPEEPTSSTKEDVKDIDVEDVNKEKPKEQKASPPSKRALEDWTQKDSFSFLPKQTSPAGEALKIRRFSPLPPPPPVEIWDDKKAVKRRYLQETEEVPFT
ncbi:uncharacterized protein LOC129354925 [Poeciliopsis prolifica]|uniref:uncharacterized protein LOC129354925 n=1 Tax=Poeciliopsis prolifica TaxID=188132 RepID=UPI0024144063|nr:uncharacterized protein LOC129354925 [Poeciliopsis prolifica]